MICLKRQGGHLRTRHSGTSFVNCLCTIRRALTLPSTPVFISAGPPQTTFTHGPFLLDKCSAHLSSKKKKNPHFSAESITDRKPQMFKIQRATRCGVPAPVDISTVQSLLLRLREHLKKRQKHSENQGL